MRLVWLMKFIAVSLVLTLSLTAFANKENNNSPSGRSVKTTLSGSVIASKGNAPVDYSTVYLKGTQYGAMTDEKGQYSFEVPNGSYTLIVSSVGYEQKEIPVLVDNSSLTVNVELEESMNLLDEVVVTVKTKSREERENGFALSVIDTKKAAVSNIQTSELLNRTSGVKLRQSGGAGSDIQYNINGLSGNSVRIFIDGVPMENYGNSFSISSLPPSLIDRIDVYKGVVPAHLTDDALGGAINIVLKHPTSKSLSSSYTYGSLNTHKWDLNANFRDSKSGFTFQATAFFNHSDNNYKVWGDQIKITDPQNGKIERIKADRFHDAYQSKGITINTGFTRVRWADKLLLSLICSDMKKEIQHGATMDVVYGNRHSSQHTLMGRLQYDKKNIFNKLDLSANASLSRGNRQVVDTVAYMYNWLGEIMTDRNGKQLKWNKGGGEGGKATLATNIENTFTGRARAAYHFLPKQTLAANVLFNAFTRDVKDPYLTEIEQNFTDTRRINKTILSIDYKGKFFHDKLQANAFYKHYNQAVQLTDPVMNNGVMEADRISRSITADGFGGALSYKVGKKVILTASSEYATRLPGVTELLGNTTNNIQSSYDLKPERSLNVNLGAVLGTFKIKEHSLEADINLFYRDITDMIQKSLTNPTDEMYGYENLGKVLSRGVDAVLKYNYRHHLFSEVNVSYTDARFNLQYDKHGTEYLYYRDRLRNNPFFTANWNLEYVAENWIQKKSRMSFTYNLGYVHQFYRNWESLGGAGKAVIPSQLVHDLGLVYSFPKRNFSVGVDVKNLLNEQVFDNWALQKPGRMILAKISYSIAR